MKVDQNTDWQDAYFTALEKLKTETLEPADMSVLWGRVKAVTMAFAALRAHADALAGALGHTSEALERELAERVDESLSEEELIEWLGKDYGRMTIGHLIRLRQARTALANYSAWLIDGGAK